MTKQLPRDERVIRTADDSSERIYFDILFHGQNGSRYVTVHERHQGGYFVEIGSASVANLSDPEWEPKVLGPYRSLSAATRAANVALTA